MRPVPVPVPALQVYLYLGTEGNESLAVPMPDRQLFSEAGE